ncbi:MAG: hypothetical protein WDK96_01765 [Candidatus Paceibacterota bacterium]|jgi:hypothetical protein
MLDLSGENQNETDKIEDLNKKLYSSNQEILPKRKKGILRQVSLSVPTSWKDSGQKIVNEVKKSSSNNSLFKKFFIFSIGFFALSLIFVGVSLFRGSTTVSDENIDISILGNAFTAGGEELPLQIEITNKNSSPLELSDLLVEYAKGTGSDGNIDYERMRRSIGGIKAGETIHENLKLVLFGEQGSIKDINISLEYRLQGSNAIFVKKKVYSVNINSAPLSLLVDAPTSMTPGQEINFKIKTTFNAEKTAKGVILKVIYPPGFQFDSAEPKTSLGNNTWALGDLSAGSEKNISIKGIVVGTAGEEKSFHVYTGEQKGNDQSTIAVPYSSLIHTVKLEKPFLETQILINGEDKNDYTADGNSEIGGVVKWSNNLSVAVSDVVVTAKFSGNAIDESSIVPSGGFYNSTTNEIIWDKNTESDFTSIDPGEKGSLSFRFSSLPLLSGSKLIENPNIVVEVSIKGKQSGEGGASSEVNDFQSKTIKINSDLKIVGQSLYFTGPINNSGPIPPKVGSKTTYTIVWSVTNSANIVSQAEARALLPIYVDWVGGVTPASENVTYDSGTREVVWKIGNVKRGAGLTGDEKEVAFQIELLPSLSQVGTAPVLIYQTKLTGFDTYTNITNESTTSQLTTKLIHDNNYVLGNETVVQ